LRHLPETFTVKRVEKNWLHITEDKMAGIFTKRIWQPSPAASTAFVVVSRSKQNQSFS